LKSFNRIVVYFFEKISYLAGHPWLIKYGGMHDENLVPFKKRRRTKEKETVA
jgi:hypothetical protein